MAPSPDSGLYVSIPARAAIDLVLLDSAGRPRPGWPIKLPGATDCAPPSAADDGSVRLVCSTGAASAGAEAPQRAYAFDGHGRKLAGFPVDVDGATSRIDQRLIGDQLFLVAHRKLTKLDPATGSAFGEAWLVNVTADGVVRAGVRVRDEVGGVPTQWLLGPNGIAYGKTGADRWLSAFDGHGIRPGWPVRIDGLEPGAPGSASNPAFGPHGRLYLTVVSFAPDALYLLILDPDGRTVARGGLPVTADELDGWALVDDPPIVAQDGSAVVADMAMYRLDATARPIAGWPFRDFEIARPGYCPPNEPYPCDFPAVAPVVSSDDVVHLLDDLSHPAKGWSVTAIGPNGHIRPGWPVTLRATGSEFWSIATSPDGTTFALAVEPESAGRYSATVLAIAPTGFVRYRSTIVEP